MNLSNNIDFDIKHFFLWWGRELSYWIPEKIRQALSDKSGYVFLSAVDNVLQFTRINHGQKQIIAEISLNEISQEQYQQLIAEDSELEKAYLILRLNSDQAFKKILYLPAAAKENLQQVVTFEIDKYTPFTAEQVYFAVKILDKEENGQIKVLLVLTPKDIMLGIYMHLENAKIYPNVVDYAGAANNFEEDLDTYNLLPELDALAKNKTTQFFSWFFGFVLLMLTVAVLAFPVWNEGQTVDSLRLKLKQLEKSAHLVQAQQLEIDEIVDETARLVESKNSSPSLTGLMNILSQLLPNDTWLTHLKYNNNKLNIQGQSPSASALIGVMEASPLFSNARFVSPLTQDKKTGFERFQISVEVKAQGVVDVK